MTSYAGQFVVGTFFSASSTGGTARARARARARESAWFDSMHCGLTFWAIDTLPHETDSPVDACDTEGSTFDVPVTFDEDFNELGESFQQLDSIMTGASAHICTH